MHSSLYSSTRPYHGCFHKGTNNDDCQKYETGSQLDMDYQHHVVTPYMPKMLVEVLLRFALPVLLIVVGRVLGVHGSVGAPYLMINHWVVEHTTYSNLLNVAARNILKPRLEAIGCSLIKC